ncbi:hypothetical protein OS493_024322 [Desmophyllum pertusum]|uniref:Uncharacterized protein n=1 Tax=Desmophyllum pertusum TaxID=174260 RepID=A0A9W9YY55_9CNID|nr:hypothetical protein OS493_024322 [Desmophyllum pertusum]
MSPIETTESSTQTSPISEEEELLLKEHIQFHSEMKDFLERALLKGQNEGVLALRVFIKNKPKKPKTSLNRLFLEDNSPQNDETESSTHEYLKTKLTQESLPIFSSLSLSDSESWNTVSEKIKNTNQRCQRGSGVCLSGHIQLGHLLEAGQNCIETRSFSVERKELLMSGFEKMYKCHLAMQGNYEQLPGLFNLSLGCTTLLCLLRRSISAFQASVEFLKFRNTKNFGRWLPELAMTKGLRSAVSKDGFS